MNTKNLFSIYLEMSNGVDYNSVYRTFQAFNSHLKTNGTASFTRKLIFPLLAQNIPLIYLKFTKEGTYFSIQSSIHTHKASLSLPIKNVRQTIAYLNEFIGECDLNANKFTCNFLQNLSQQHEILTNYYRNILINQQKAQIILNSYSLHHFPAKIPNIEAPPLALQQYSCQQQQIVSQQFHFCQQQHLIYPSY